jgi:hypothetical protein
MRRFGLSLAAGLLAAAAGCVVVAEDPGRPHGRVVVVASNHICTAACDHYYWDGAWYVVEAGHRHGPGCGHVLVSGKWGRSKPGKPGRVVEAKEKKEAEKAEKKEEKEEKKEEKKENKEAEKKEKKDKKDKD